LFLGDPVEFLSWLLNALHLALNGKKTKKSSSVYRTFLGAMKIHSQRIPPIDATDTEKSELMMTAEYVETQTDSPFLFLAADLPPPPLFKDEFRENIIPQVSLFALLSQFNGVQQKEYKTYKENFLKRFELTRMPRYIILNIKVS
jgi:U4/U6.U5 tri-snRNP-associated protein 2